MEGISLGHSSQEIARELHEAAGRVRGVLQVLLAEGTESVSQIVTPQQMSMLLSELMRAGECLRVLPKRPDPDLVQEIREYRGEVERLHAILPSIQTMLLAERARLQQQRERVNAAAAWAQASRETIQK